MRFGHGRRSAACCGPSAAAAQTPRRTARARHPTDDTRPATTTSYGDTGLWFVPTAEVLRRRQVVGQRLPRGTELRPGLLERRRLRAARSASGSRIAPRSSARSWSITRIDRDVRPLFAERPDVGGLVDRYPVRQHDLDRRQPRRLLVGVKVNLLSEAQQKPVAIAVRGIVKLPTGDKDVGRQHRQDGLVRRFHRQQGSARRRRNLRLRRRRVPRQTRTMSTRRPELPLGHRRRLPVAQSAARHDRTERREAVRRHGSTTVGPLLSASTDRSRRSSCNTANLDARDRRRRPSRRPTASSSAPA